MPSKAYVMTQRLKRILQDLTEIDPDLDEREYKDKVAAVQARAENALDDLANRGNPEIAKARISATKANTRKSLNYLNDIRPLIESFQAAGNTTPPEILKCLEKSHVSPQRGGEWTYNKVAHLLRKLESLAASEK